MSTLLEKSRNELISQSKRGEREKGDGKTRYEKRLKSKISSSNRSYNRIDMNTLFKEGILTVGIEVKGETDNYIVKISYGHFIDTLRELMRNNNEELNLRVVIKTLTVAFNRGDVYLHCSCPDFKYRFNYWATVDKYNDGEPELRPANITNPDNKLGAACKHVLLVLGNSSWIIKVASVIVNYIKYMEKSQPRLYQRIIYPAIYNKKYEEPTQSSMFDTEEDKLGTEQKDIDIANKAAIERSRFQKDNKQGVRFAPKQQLQGQEEIEIEDEEEFND